MPERPDEAWMAQLRQQFGSELEHADLTDTLDHIAKVQRAMRLVLSALEQRAAAHDRSKLSEPERSGYARLQARLAGLEYGSPEYRAAVADAQAVIAHHYAQNRHHPEHHAAGVDGMSLLDLLEMFCDWYAASRRSPGGSLAQSLAINQQRFAMSPQLAAILENTRRELGWG